MFNFLLASYYDVKSWLKYFYKSRRYPLPDINVLKNLKTSNKAVILGTGPSVKDIDFSKLQGYDCYSVSNFFLHDELGKINIRAHFFAPWHPPLERDNYNNWLKKCGSVLNKDIPIFLAESDYENTCLNNIFEDRKLIFLCLTSRHSPRMSVFGPLVEPVTGPQMILPVICCLMYEEVYFVGCDHNMLKNYRSHTEHFYDSIQDFRLNASCPKSWSGIVTELKNNLKLFYTYQKYFKANPKIKFYNTSEYGWLDFIEYFDGFKKDNKRNLE